MYEIIILNLIHFKWTMNNLETVINVLLQKSGKEIFLKILFTGLIKNKILRLSIEELS